jgi:hypothetical protein
MIHGVDENGGGSDGQRGARVETSLDSLPRSIHKGGHTQRKATSVSSHFMEWNLFICWPKEIVFKIHYRV